MIKSEYINDILNLLLDGDIEGLNAKKQIPFLSEKDQSCSIGGLYVYFEHKIGIEDHKSETRNLVLDGIKITFKDVEANAILFFKEGLIDFLEIWCVKGNYPSKELKTYTLTQTWIGSENKSISRP